MSELAGDLLGQLRQVFGNDLYSAGESLLARGCVADLRILQSGSVITGVAQPLPGPKCRVYIQLPAAPAGAARQLSGECSCGAVVPCMHVAAVSIAAAKQAQSAHAVSMPQPRAPGGGPGARAVAGQQHRLCYVFETAAAAAGSEDLRSAELRVSLWVASASADRIEAAGATRFELRSGATDGHFPRYVDAHDRQLIATLASLLCDGSWWLGAQAWDVLRQAMATGRAFWQSLQSQALRCGPPLQLQLSWRTQPSGVQRLCCESASTIGLFLQSDPGLYVDATAARCGCIEPPCPLPMLRRYWSQQIVPAAIAASNAELAQYPSMPLLRSLSVVRQPLRSVRGRLCLQAQLAGTLHFIYNDLCVASEVPDAVAVVHVMPEVAADVIYEIDRDRAREAQLRAQLEQALPNCEPGPKRRMWLLFMLQQVPMLQADGWEIIIPDDFPLRIAPAGDWSMELESEPHTREHGWFDLRLGVTVESRWCNLLPAVLSYLQCAATLFDAGNDGDFYRLEEQLLLRLDDGRYLPVPIARIQRIAETLVELFDHDSLNSRQALTLPVSQAGRIALLAEELTQTRVHCQDASLLRLIEELRGAGAITPLAAPAGFRATLRHYQEEGLGWLQFLRRCGCGGILADDMGLGKTLQTLAHLVLLKRSGVRRPSLIVAPVSVIGNWQQELRRWAPELDCIVLHGNRRRELFAHVAGSDVVLTGYPQLQLDSELLLALEFELVVLDEAQTIKNSRTKVAQVARALRAEHRLCLTGTPMENHLGELWSLLDFLQPGLLGSESEFQRHYRTPIEKNGDAERAQALSRRIAPFVLRRTKQAVAAELPEKTHIIESIVLDERQRDFYDAIRLAMHRRVQEVIEQQGLARSHITMLDALLKLRQACCDPRLVKLERGLDVEPQATIPSAKLQWLSTVLPELMAEGRRVLLFSQFTSMLALIEAVLQEMALPYCLLTGQTRERAALVEKFQSGNVPLFLISLKAGGTGLNLTAADTVIHYDPWWNPAVEAQATDRAHRIGQQQRVFVYKLIAQDTVEEKILQLQADKHALANQLYTQQLAPSQLSAADLAALLD